MVNQFTPRQIKNLPEYLKNQSMETTGFNASQFSIIKGLKYSLRKKFPGDQKFDNLQVRQGKELSSAELNFVNNRMPKVIESLKTNFDIDTPFKIALCSSGGGNRAMLTTLGFFLGAQDIGLFDASLYSAGVSGSTWTIAPWSYLYATQGMSLLEFKNKLVAKLDTTIASVAGISLPPALTQHAQVLVSNNIIQRYAYDQHISSIDVYGGIIGNFSLLGAGKDKLNVKWSSIASFVEKGEIPLPMGAAVSYEEGQFKKGMTDYYWFEVGPFEVGSDQINGYIPTQSFGSKFKKGKPVNGYAGHAPEYPISYYEGVYGSAFAASMNEVLDRAVKNPTVNFLGTSVTLPFDLWIRKSMTESMRDARFYPATFHNYMKGVDSSPIAQSKTIRLYDGAMNFNFPLPLVMRPARQVDVVVICDASKDIIELQTAQRHFIKEGIKFPDLSKYSQKIIESQHLTVLNDPRSGDYDQDIVTILYCPLIKNNEYSTSFDPVKCAQSGVCRTFNFKYTQSEATKIVDLAQFNVNFIKNEIKDVLQSLQKKRSQQVTMNL